MASASPLETNLFRSTEAAAGIGSPLSTHGQMTDPPNIEPLKPCPFCGGTAHLWHPMVSIQPHIWCGQCLASTAGQETIERAVERWNQRPGEAAAAAASPGRGERAAG